MNFQGGQHGKTFTRLHSLDTMIMQNTWILILMHVGLVALLICVNIRLEPSGEEVRYTDQEYEDSSDGERQAATAPAHRLHRTRSATHT
jgi:hypothetical protein